MLYGFNFLSRGLRDVTWMFLITCKGKCWFKSCDHMCSCVRVIYTHRWIPGIFSFVVFVSLVHPEPPKKLRVAQRTSPQLCELVWKHYDTWTVFLMFSQICFKAWGLSHAGLETGRQTVQPMVARAKSVFPNWVASGCWQSLVKLVGIIHQCEYW